MLNPDQIQGGRVGHPLFAEEILILSFSFGWPILAGLVHARVGLSFSYFEFLPTSLLLFPLVPCPRL